MLIPQAIVQGGGAQSGIAVISDSTLGVDTASFDVTGISQAYKHLEVIGDLRSTEAAIQTEVCVQLNGDSGSNYEHLYHFVVPSTTGQSTASVSDTKMIVGLVAGASSGTATDSGAIRILIPNYTGTTFRKNLHVGTSLTREAGNDPAITIGTGIWEATTAIDRITVFPASGNWKAGSRLTVYGL